MSGILPQFPARATRYLIPGVNYNGNGFVRKMWNSLDIPTGWEKDGEPWVFAYDRCGIPSCTVSENEHEVFANERFVAVHTKDGGEIKVSLPRRYARITDLLADKVVAENADSFTCAFSSPDTRLFDLSEND